MYFSIQLCNANFLVSYLHYFQVKLKVEGPFNHTLLLNIQQTFFQYFIPFSSCSVYVHMYRDTFVFCLKSKLLYDHMVVQPVKLKHILYFHLVQSEENFKLDDQEQNTGLSSTNNYPGKAFKYCTVLVSSFIEVVSSTVAY